MRELLLAKLEVLTAEARAPCVLLSSLLTYLGASLHTRRWYGQWLVAEYLKRYITLKSETMLLLNIIKQVVTSLVVLELPKKKHRNHLAVT